MEYKNSARTRNRLVAGGFAGRWGGLLTSVAVGVVFLGIIGWSLLKSNGPPSTANGATQNDPELLPEPIVTGPITTIADLGTMYLEMTAKDDPNKLTAIIEAEKVEPIDANERLVESPSAWVFLANGQFGRMDADTGRFFMPDPNAPPESGLLEGNVTLRVFAATENGEPPVIEGDGAVESIAVATFDEALRFDFRRSRLSTPGPFVLETPTVEMAGTNLTVVFNEVQQRIELLEVRQGEYIRFTQAASDADAATANANPTSTPVAGEAESTRVEAFQVAAQPPEIAPEPVGDLIAFYHLTFLDGIDVSHATQQIRGDQLDLWFRMVNGALPQGAISPLQAAARDASLDDPIPTNQPASDPTTQTAQGSEDPSTTQPGPVTTVDAMGVVTMRWTGPMRLQPLGEDQPEALRENDMAMRMTAEKSGFVEFSDPESGASGRTVALDYGFTSATLSMSGPGGNVSLVMNESGRLEASRMIASLGTGQIHVRGPGAMRVGGTQDGDRGAEPTTIRWSEQADFAFLTVDGRVTDQLKSAVLDGSVEGSNGSSRMNGDRLTARFTQDESGQTRLDSLEIEQGRAEDRLGEYLQGDVLIVEFADGTREHDLDPIRIEAFGNVRAGQPGSEIVAGEMFAQLGRDLDGQIRLERIDANGAVVFTGEDGSRAETEILTADALSESVTLRGADSMLSFGGATIRGEDVMIDRRNRRASVRGEGLFEQRIENPEGSSKVLASWTDQMSFDDFLGRAEFVGNAVVVSEPSPFQIDTVRSGRVLITLSPFTETSPESGEVTRKLLTATAYGTTDLDGNPEPASVESRVFATKARRLVEQLLYLEGMQIIANNETSELAVPSAGKLLLLDRRAGNPVPESEGPDPIEQDQAMLTELASGGPGLTRFEWRGGMLMHRSEGTASMKRSVKITHKNLASGKTYELHAERIDATIRESGREGSTDGPGSSELQRAEATGAVYFGSKERELIADRLLYDAENGVVIGTAAEGNLVTLFDATRGTPITSRAIRWDLVNDVISIEKPGAIVTPTGR